MSVGTWTGKHPWMTFFLASSAIAATAGIVKGVSGGGFGRLGDGACGEGFYGNCVDQPAILPSPGTGPRTITRPPTLGETVKEFLEQPACGYPLWQVLSAGAVGAVLIRGLTK